MPLPGHAPKSGAISAVNAATIFNSTARQAKAAGIDRDELREELGRLRNAPGAGAAAAVVAASTGQRASTEEGGAKKANKDEVTAALKEHWTKRSADSLFYRLYPQSNEGTSEEDMDRWCRRVAARLAGEEEGMDDGPVSDAVMSGALAGMKMAEKNKELEKEALKQTLLDILPAGPEDPARAMQQKLEITQNLLAMLPTGLREPPAAKAPVASPRMVPANSAAQSAASAAAEKPVLSATPVDAVSRGEDLAKLSVKQLKQRIAAVGATIPAGVAEKSELVDFLQKSLDTGSGGRCAGVAHAGAAVPPEDTSGATVFL